MADDWDSRAAFDKTLWSLDKSSSPGYPLMKEAPTVGQWLKWTPSGPDQTQAERLWQMVKQVFELGYDHYFRVFVKDEPHKVAKAIEGRWRLIIASSLPVMVSFNMAFKTMNDKLNDLLYQTPSMQGLVLCYGGWKRFKAEARALNLCMSKDLSGWDFNSPGWVFRADLELRTRLCDNPTAQWVRLTEWLYADAFQKSKLKFSNGMVYQQEFEGFMKSGIFNTISTNSAAMYFLHVAASLRAGIPLTVQYAVGDDTIQSPFPDNYIDELEQLGCRVKMVEHGVEFVGTDFREGPPMPMYFDKHLLSVVQTDELSSTLDSFCRLYAHSPRIVFWRTLAQDLGVPVHSVFYYKFWYDSPLAAVLGWA